MDRNTTSATRRPRWTEIAHWDRSLAGRGLHWLAVPTRRRLRSTRIFSAFPRERISARFLLVLDFCQPVTQFTRKKKSFLRTLSSPLLIRTTDVSSTPRGISEITFLPTPSHLSFFFFRFCRPFRRLTSNTRTHLIYTRTLDAKSLGYGLTRSRCSVRVRLSVSNRRTTTATDHAVHSAQRSRIHTHTHTEYTGLPAPRKAYYDRPTKDAAPLMETVLIKTRKKKKML